MVSERKIILNTLPKSGTIYLSRLIADGLRLDRGIAYLGNAYSLIDQISLEKTHRFITGNKISANHLAPSVENIQILQHFKLRIVLHIRDPRQSLLSWTHHLDRICGQSDLNENLLRFVPRTPPGYLGWDFGRKLDWQIENYYQQLVRWLSDWVEIFDTKQIEILITTNDELKEDELRLVRRILKFYEIDEDEFTLLNIPKTVEETHFRKADPEEWLSVFSKDQISQLNSGLSTEMTRRFGFHQI